MAAMALRARALPAALLLALAACEASSPAPAVDRCATVRCGGHASCLPSSGRCGCDPGFLADATGACLPSVAPAVGGCALFPADHLFNTPIDALPVHPQSAAFLATIGAHRVHLDMGRTVDQASVDTYWGIPYNVVDGAALGWTPVRYFTTDGGAGQLGWDPRPESDCVEAGATGRVISPCTAAAAPHPAFPIPAAPLVEGGIDRTASQPYGDHHLLLLDSSACRLWELYHVYPDASSGWDVYGSATWDLASSALRPDGWTSSDAAGFPILPLLLRADEAASGAIRHALRFTIPTTRIRIGHAWPARHDTSNGTTSTSLPPMGALFRLKGSYAIPAGFSTQSRAILQAMKTYGLYLADGGSALFVQGEPSAGWDEAIWAEVQSVGSDALEAVDLSPFTARAGWSADSARVPPP
jgi:hypothetical protein